MKFNNPENTIFITSSWDGERFGDGRPRVSDDLLERLRLVTTEEAWSPLWKKGYRFQQESNFKTTHAGARLIGRAVTTVMVPSRPDVHLGFLDYGHNNENYRGYFNQWVIDGLQENDVVVVDLFDKIVQGTYVGGNLSTSIKARTKKGGAVIWGGIRDLEQIMEIPDFQVFYRGSDPAAIADAMMVGINLPCRIGNAVCMPGDVVLGTISGVTFIPPHLAEEVAEAGEKTRLKDIFGFERLKSNTYTSAQIDVSVWAKELMDDFQGWLKTSPEAEKYQYLDWSQEIEATKNASPNSFIGLTL